MGESAFVSARVMGFAIARDVARRSRPVVVGLHCLGLHVSSIKSVSN